MAHNMRYRIKPDLRKDYWGRDVEVYVLQKSRFGIFWKYVAYFTIRKAAEDHVAQIRKEISERTVHKKKGVLYL